MNLYRKQSEFWPWFCRALKTLIKADPARTLFVIAAMGIGRITSVLALLLPLKVVLLAASEGVPRYFRFFIQPEEKGQWIVYLALGAVFLYLITLLLDSLADRLMESTSGKVLGNATQINVVNKQEDKAQSHFSRFCRVTAYLLFFMVGMAIIAVIHVDLFYSLCALFAFFYIITSWLLSGPDDLNPGRLKALALNGYRNYITTLGSLSFLSGFIVILAPLVRGAGGNVLFSIVALLLMRQMLSAGATGLRTAVILAKQRAEISSLLFPEQHYARNEPKVDQAFRNTFEHDNRHAMLQGLRHHETDEVSTRWEDCAVSGMSTFFVDVSSSYDVSSCYQHQVFIPKKAHILKNEELLFKHISRSDVWAPSVVSSFTKGAFECQICEAGSGMPVGKDYSRWERAISNRLWACSLPQGLLDAYASAHPMLHTRLDEALLARLSVAVDSHTERENLAWILQVLPSIHQVLMCLPPCIHNPDISPSTVLYDREQTGVILMTWGRWRIEPLGALIPKAMAKEEVSGLIDELALAREDIDSRVSVNDVLLSRSCWHLDRHIQARRFKKALGEVAIINMLLELDTASQVVSAHNERV